MANKKDTERENLLDDTERLWIMGVRKPYQLMKILPIANWDTANTYLRIVEHRVARRHRKVDKVRAFQQQMIFYDQIRIELWSCYRQALAANNTNGCIGAINGLTRVLRNEAELLGLQPPTAPQNTVSKPLSPEQRALVGQALEYAFKRAHPLEKQVE